jgi:hypothetical protein
MKFKEVSCINPRNLPHIPVGTSFLPSASRGLREVNLNFATSILNYFVFALASLSWDGIHDILLDKVRAKVVISGK